MDTIKIEDITKTARATIVGDILYIDEPKKRFLPKYVYYLLLSKGCTKACFGASTRIYKIEDLKDMEDWNVKERRKEN